MTVGLSPSNHHKKNLAQPAGRQIRFLHHAALTPSLPHSLTPSLHYIPVQVPGRTMPRSSTSSRREEQQPRALLLGMVYSKEVPPKRGQMFRDRVRCQAMEKHGYIVSTLDDKHEENSAEDLKHCRSNFANANRMWRNILSVWSSGGARGVRTDEDIIATTYDTVILDYFFSPAGWVNTRWTEKFFSETLPLLVERGMLKSTGSVWLPHLDHVDAMLQKFSHILCQHYTWTIEEDPVANPLFKATDDVSDELLRCPDNLTNDTQIMPLMELPGM